jgi:hypothetical protein
MWRDQTGEGRSQDVPRRISTGGLTMDDLKETVIKLLQDNNIKRGSKSYGDYERCKFYLELLDLDSIQWHDACVIVSDYLGI